jgi:hypothetical protein
MPAVACCRGCVLPSRQPPAARRSTGRRGYPLRVPLLLVKLLLTPVLIGGASLVARRWGPALAGWLVALPLTSGPVVVYVALEHGVPLGIDVGLAVISGGFGLCAYAITYARAATATGARWSFALATAAFLVAGLAVAFGNPTSLGPLSIGVAIAMLAAILLVPAAPAVHAASRPPRWDLPARVIVGTTLVVGLSALAPILGSRLSGLAATIQSTSRR